jgi:hypothetical protein
LPLASVLPTDLNPDFTGVWLLNVEKSVSRGEIPAKTLMKIEHTQATIVQQLRVIYSDARETLLVFHYDTGNETFNNIGGSTARSRIRWEGLELVIESWLNLKDRELRLADYWSISIDGKTLTMEHRDDALAGQISVLDKASPEAAACFPEREK